MQVDDNLASPWKQRQKPDLANKPTAPAAGVQIEFSASSWRPTRRRLQLDLTRRNEM
jgi:hypothetical protein